MMKKITPAAINAAQNALTDMGASGVILNHQLRTALNAALDHVYDTDDVKQIQSPQDLLAFRVEHDIASDWDEPGSQNITATFIGENGDFSSESPWVDDVLDYDGEMAVVLWETSDDDFDSKTDRPTLERPLAVVNLAMLFKWATG